MWATLRPPTRRRRGVDATARPLSTEWPELPAFETVDRLEADQDGHDLGHDVAADQWDDGTAPVADAGPRTVARLLSFSPHPPKRDRLCVDTAALLRPLLRAGVIDSWATDHTYPTHRAWRLIPSRLAVTGQLPLDGYVEPDGGITLFTLDDAFRQPPLSMLDWILDWTNGGRLASHWWTTAVHVTATAGLPTAGTVRA
ncbi:hypothetical protein [Catellatospora tritici]|uniref:hypothetical protein n=1 Tax=Catellatospora tritici TaxID=2851566 RepID=UPI001C2DC85F|nr:hypothetical protein [Catellatospora tritici]MBV1851723.1 hypothetical protein [Catellatospora tritici]